MAAKSFGRASPKSFGWAVTFVNCSRRMQGANQWRAAPRLVGDFRFTVRGRRYPDRNLTMSIG